MQPHPTPWRPQIASPLNIAQLTIKGKHDPIAAMTEPLASGQPGKSQLPHWPSEVVLTGRWRAIGTLQPRGELILRSGRSYMLNLQWFAVFRPARCFVGEQ